MRSHEYDIPDLIGRGDVEGARALARGSAAPRRLLADTFIQLGRPDDALAEVRAEPDEARRREDLIWLAEAFVELAHADRAKAIAEALLADDDRMRTPIPPAEAAQLMLLAGSTDDAVRRAGEVVDSARREPLLFRAVDNLVAANAFGRAQEVAALLRSPLDRLSAQVSVIEKAASAGHSGWVPLAMTMADAEPANLRLVAGRLAPILREHGDRALAAVFAGRAKSPEFSLAVFRRAIEEGDRAGAARTLDEVHAMAMTVTDQNEYRRLMIQAVECAAEAGDLEMAAIAARKIGSSAAQGRELAKLAAIGGDRARVLAAEALTTEGWFEAITVVGRIDPEALREFAAVLCG